MSMMSSLSDWPGVFVSSTCYDLLDLRAELEVCIRDLGLIPVMSDRPSSEFDPGGYRDSITTCLENVKKCPTFVCVLSNRYGPRLGKSGFDDISATHLEYRAAVEAKRRILVYARDRLLGDHQVWKNATRAGTTVPKLPWVDADQYGIFELLTEHMKLSPGNDPNWVWPFRDSVELKSRLSLDLGAVSRRAKLSTLIEHDRIPLFALAVTSSNTKGPNKREATLQITNMGPIAATEVEVGFSGQHSQHVASAIPAGSSAASRVEFDVVPKQPVKLVLVLRYSTPYGHRIEEQRSFESPDAVDYVVSRSGRSIRLLDQPAFLIE
jgi:hypothetical protein